MSSGLATLSDDALSGLLRGVRLRGALFFHVDCVGAWVTEAPRASLIAATLMPTSEHMMAYHVVLEGTCWAGVGDEPPIRMDAGDVIVFPHGDSHVMSSVPGLRAEPDLKFFANNPRSRFPIMVRLEGKVRTLATREDSTRPRHAGDRAVLLCGFLGCDRGPFNPLLEALPQVIHVPASGLSDNSWSAQLSQLAAAEARERRPGRDAVLERMSEMMFVDLVRIYLENMPENQTGWLAGLRDRHIGRVLQLIHERPAEAWTLELLSRHAGLSRSSLRDRFVEIVKQPPMQYLKHWRMQLAASLLVESNVKLANIARDVGYESEAAFSRTFKRTVGVPPSVWRRERAASG